MRNNRYPMIDGDAHITERNSEILRQPGENHKGTRKYNTRATLGACSG